MKEEEVGNKVTEMMMRGMTITTKLEVLFDHFQATKINNCFY